MMHFTRRSALATIASVGSVTALSGCTLNAHAIKAKNIEWVESGIERIDTEESENALVYVVARNKSSEVHDIIIRLRVSTQDGTLITDWKHTQRSGVPPEQAARLETKFELPPSVLNSIGKSSETENDPIILFKAARTGSKAPPEFYLDNGQVKRYRNLPSNQD